MASSSAETPVRRQEKTILTRIHSYCPGLTPLPEYSSTEDLMTKEKCCTLGNSLLTAHNERDVDLSPIGNLASQLGQLHSATSPRVLGKETHAKLAAEFGDTAATNAMDQAVFVQPYQTQDSSSHAAELTTNTQLRDEVERLRQRMRTEKECLIHGNLNTNAVVFKDGKPKLINWGACRMGPAGYDLGVLVGHLFLSYHQHMLTPEDNDSHRTVMYAAWKACEEIGRTYLSTVLPSVAESERVNFESKLMSDAAGYAGCELIRCVVSTEKSPELLARPEAVQEVMQAGIRLITSAHRIDSMGRLLMIGLMLC